MTRANSKNSPVRVPASPARRPACETSWQGQPAQMRSTAGRAWHATRRWWCGRHRGARPPESGGSGSSGGPGRSRPGPRSACPAGQGPGRSRRCRRTATGTSSAAGRCRASGGSYAAHPLAVVAEPVGIGCGGVTRGEVDLCRGDAGRGAGRRCRAGPACGSQRDGRGGSRGRRRPRRPTPWGTARAARAIGDRSGTGTLFANLRWRLVAAGRLLDWPRPSADRDLNLKRLGRAPLQSRAR